MAQNTGLKGFRDALKATWPEYPPPVPQELLDIKAEAERLLAEQIYTTPVEMNGLRNIAGTCAPPPEPYEMTYHYFTTEENPMGELNQNSYGKAAKIGPLPNPSPDAVAKAHRKQAARIEAQVKAQKKAAKKAKRAERQRQEDIACALDTLVNIANGSELYEATPRVEAAKAILAHYHAEY